MMACIYSLIPETGGRAAADVTAPAMEGLLSVGGCQASLRVVHSQWPSWPVVFPRAPLCLLPKLLGSTPLP